MSFLYFCRRIKSVGKSRTNTISKDHLKNLVPFTEEWLAVMEAFGEVSLLASWTFWACQIVIYMSRLSCVLHNCLFLFYLYGPSPVFLGEVELGLCPEINFMICNMNCHPNRLTWSLPRRTSLIESSAVRLIPEFTYVLTGSFGTEDGRCAKFSYRQSCSRT